MTQAPESVIPVIDSAFVSRQRTIRTLQLYALYVVRFYCTGTRSSGFTEMPDCQDGYDPDEWAYALIYLTEIGHITRSGNFYRIAAQGMQVFEKEFE